MVPLCGPALLRQGPAEGDRRGVSGVPPTSFFEVLHRVTEGRAAVWSAPVSSRSSLVIDSLLLSQLPGALGCGGSVLGNPSPMVPHVTGFRISRALLPCTGDCFQLMAGRREGVRMQGKMSQAQHENAALPSITH